MLDSIKARLRKCFDEITDEYNGGLICPLIESAFFMIHLPIGVQMNLYRNYMKTGVKQILIKGVNQN